MNGGCSGVENDMFFDDVMSRQEEEEEEEVDGGVDAAS